MINAKQKRKNLTFIVLFQKIKDAQVSPFLMKGGGKGK